MSFCSKNKDFVLLMGGQICSTLADLLFNVSIILFIYSESSSLVSTTFAIVLSTLSKMLGSFFATHFLDKIKSKKIIIISWIFKLLFVIISQLFIRNTIYIYVFLSSYSFMSAIASPAVGTLLSHLSKGAELIRLNSIYNLSLQLIQTAAWGISIPIINFLGTSKILITIIVFYCISIGFMYDIHRDLSVGNYKADNKTFWTRFHDGVQALRENEIVRNITIMDLAETAANIIWTQSFMLAFTIKMLHSESEWLGYQTSFYFIGSIVGGSAVLLLLRTFSQNAGKVIIISSLTVAIASLIYTFNTSPVLALLINFVIGLPYQIRDVMQQSLIQEKTDNKTIGRVLAIRDVSISVIYIVSLIIGGILGEFFGIRLVYFMASLIYIIVSIIIARNNNIRNYRM
ncbi:MFS transporter [Streptococcus anginosus]|uniref:MFS transporter n=1 Tax=Streptococcus anginosus TaxID=1328 RepID=UPI00195E3DD0|nr:MFS transporter [Streptococcus anginosus]QRR97625.1 MFS transporter [Streptococcus anginosus]